MTAVAHSPFASAAPDLLSRGYTPLPLIPPSAGHHKGRGKAPGAYVSGSWRGLDGWQKYRDEQPAPFHLGMWNRAPDANIGLVLGTQAGPGLHVIAIDVDTIDFDAYEQIIGALPRSNMSKRGAKGITLFYKAPKTVKTRCYDDARVPTGQGLPRRLVDLLTGFETRQTVIPPSIHPDTGEAYQWVEGPVDPAELPEFDEDDLEKLEETLRTLGWDPEAQRSSRIERKPRDAAAIPDDSDPFSVAKAAALANLSAWVPALDLYSLRPARGGYECVARWRASSTGRALHERKRNLSIQRTGIKDFGTNDTYSAIDLVMAAQECSEAEALAWLEERLGLADGGSVEIALVSANTSRTTCEDHDLPEPLRPKPKTAPASADTDTEAASFALGEAPARVAEPAPRATHDVAAEVPLHLLQVPGLVGEIADWVVASARRPNRAFAIAAALLVIGTAAGRKVAGPTGSGTHLYVLALADSGSGKDHALNAIATLLSAAGMEKHIGKGEFMSHQALFSDLMQEPLTLCPMDEFGSFLRKINNRNGSGSEKAITGVLRTAWGKSFATMPSPGWATKTSKPIHSPALSLLGAATDKDFYTAIDGADLDNGFLNRFLLVATKTRPPSVEPAVSRHEVPRAISDALATLYNVAGPLERATMHGQGAGAPILTVGWSTPHVKRAFLAFENRIIERAADQPMLARVSEMAVRLATIRALGMHGVTEPVLCMDDLEWGMEFATWSAERLIADAAEHMAENQTQRDRAKIQRLIRAAGRITQRDLVRKTSGLKAREVEEITRLLETAELIRIEGGPKAANGKASKIYVWLGE